ncbi:nuclear GTPase SLIP-GC-like isoform X2 [Myripristis murdjan]|uniref:nuclear GTPase SLIP-GC-like isoform X2 n=1 Tax=Myripristis murdjan TaxID=586833 RepID=UPI001175EAB4|nr:nuclear GTPase SLIP-GC-like isoform X2 [Myripristis murdjan]
MSDFVWDKSKAGPSSRDCRTPPEKDKGKRKSARSDQPDQTELAKKKSRTSEQSCDAAMGTVLTEVKKTMREVGDRLDEQVNTELKAFLRDKINDLEKGRKETVGIFGKTGAGKSSLINTIIGEKDLLPTGSMTACTSVVTKVEANMSSCKYEAEIQFITKKEWDDELWFLLMNNNPEDPDEEDNNDAVDDDWDDHEDDDDGDDDDGKILALYGKDIRKTLEELMDVKHFREIPEFLRSTKKELKSDTAAELSARLQRFTRHDEENEAGRQYWPLVKCVTIKVPRRPGVPDLLEHVTLMDLPGTGDRNQHRNKMWKEFVGSCSTVWIMAEMNRVMAETEAWDILKNTASLMGNGGECQRIVFICTKSDDTGMSKGSKEEKCETILKRNKRAKEKVMKEFKKQEHIKKHLSDDSDDVFQVFTVSSHEFVNADCLQKAETELPKLQEFLQNLNDRQSKTSNYVSEAYGILSLIQGAKRGEKAQHKGEVCRLLEQTRTAQVQKMRRSMEEAYEGLEICLSQGVQKSQQSYEKDMKKAILHPKGNRAKGFYKKLNSMVRNGGIYKPTNKRKQTININEILASHMRNCIDRKFKEIFPNVRSLRAFKGAISKFTLHTERLADRYQDVSLHLIFLKSEEEKLKMELNDGIRERKKHIYNSLEESIRASMQPCYDDAARDSGTGTLRRMRDTIQTHLQASNGRMFNEAKEDMLRQLRSLMDWIQKTVEDKLEKSMTLSLRTDDTCIPDVSDEYDKLRRFHEALTGRPGTGASRDSVEPVGPGAAGGIGSVTPAQESSVTTGDSGQRERDSVAPPAANGQSRRTLPSLQDIAQSKRKEMPQIMMEEPGKERVPQDVPRGHATVQGLQRSFEDKLRNQQQQGNNQAAAPRPRADQTPPPPADKKLRIARTAFIKRVSEPVLDALLDELLTLEIINKGEMDVVRIKPKTEKARELIDMVMNKGADASSHMITVFCELDRYLSRELKLH